MDVIAELDRCRQRCDVLEHPFYQRWNAGELSERELAFYAREYRGAVVALAEASEQLAETAAAEHARGLRRHAAEERSHVELWDRFMAAAEAAGGAGSPGAREPLAQTHSCAQAWTAGGDALERLAILYAIEASQPQISKTKLDGLVNRYGYSPEGPAVDYFRLHATLDEEHARQARELIEALMSEDEALAREQAQRMIACAQRALRGNWELLDGVDAHFGHAAC